MWWESWGKELQVVSLLSWPPTHPDIKSSSSLISELDRIIGQPLLQSPSVHMGPLVPPLRFSVAAAANPQAEEASSSSSSSSTTLYRGAYPRKRHLPFLSKLKLVTILSLTPKPLDETITDWAKNQPNPINLIHIRCEKPKEEAGGLTRKVQQRLLRWVK